MHSRFFLFTLIVTLLFSCKEKGKVHTDNEVQADSSIATKGLELEKLLSSTDSLQVLFYDDPDGDSLRYSRFYQYTVTKDTATILALIAALNEPFDERGEVRPCRSEGKLYLFAGGDPLKTVYFSTRGDGCSYLYFIRNGLFYYFPLTAGFREKLSAARQLKKPPLPEAIAE